MIDHLFDFVRDFWKRHRFRRFVRLARALRAELKRNKGEIREEALLAAEARIDDKLEEELERLTQ